MYLLKKQTSEESNSQSAEDNQVKSNQIFNET